MHTCHHCLHPRNEQCQPVHASFSCSNGMTTSAHATFVFPRTSRLLPKLSNLLQSYKHFLRRGMTTTLRGMGACADYLYIYICICISFIFVWKLTFSSFLLCLYVRLFDTPHHTQDTPDGDPGTWCARSGRRARVGGAR